MALSTTGIVDGESPIAAAHILQFYNLLTGAMTDQPVTLRNRVAIGGNQDAVDNTLTLAGVTAQTGLQLRLLKLLGDTNPSWSVDINGVVSFGPGGASATDTTISRFAAGFLKMSSGIVVDQVATPSAPGASLNILYPKSDGFWYTRAGAAGAETAIGGTNITDPLVAQVFC